MDFFFEFGENAVEVWPVEADAGGFASELKGFEESGKGAGDAVEEGLVIGGDIGRSGGTRSR